MSFKDTHACEFIDKLSELFFDVSKSILENIILSCAFKCILEDS